MPQRTVDRARTQAIVDAIEAWVGGLPGGAFRSRALAIPPDDEYGFATLFALEPVRPQACPIEIGVTRPEAGSAVALFLDTWGNVARRLGCAVSPDNTTRKALFVEPTPMTIEKVIDACTAVVGGLVHLEAGVFRAQLVSTRGWLDTRTGRFKMHGVDDHLVPILRMMPGSVQSVRYEPWM